MPRLIRGAAIISFLSCFSAFGTTLDFDCITDNGNNCSGMVSQLDVEVIDYGAGQVQFKFNNNGPVASNITEIYWDDDANVLGAFGTPKYVASGAGVAFNDSSVNPSSLPGGNTIIPVFVATAAVDSDSGPNKGINPNEWLKVLFLLQNSKTYDDVLEALADGTLRIGMHVRSIGTAAGSDGVVNIAYVPPPPPQGDVPEPSTYALMGAGLLALTALRKRMAK